MQFPVAFIVHEVITSFDGVEKDPEYYVELAIVDLNYNGDEMHCAELRINAFPDTHFDDDTGIVDGCRRMFEDINETEDFCYGEPLPFDFYHSFLYACCASDYKGDFDRFVIETAPAWHCLSWILKKDWWDNG